MTTPSDFATMRASIASEHNCYPWTSEPEVGQFLFALCKMMQVKRVLEVGVWKGYTTLWLAEAVGWENVLAIDKEDNLPPYYPEEGKRQLVVGDSLETIPLMDGWFDLVFLDTDHQYERTVLELKALKSKVSTMGVICCHDIFGSPGVCKAVVLSELNNGLNSVFLDTPNKSGLAILRL